MKQIQDGKVFLIVLAIYNLMRCEGKKGEYESDAKSDW